MSELILASKSPRRRELLKLLGHPFTVLVSGIDEELVVGETPAEHVTRLSELKARDVGGRLGDAIVIGADTIVVLDGEILGKPSSPDEAVSMLLKLQGRTHRVYTGFALFDTVSVKLLSDYEATDVTMGSMTKRSAKRYVETGEPLDKAGSYGIQGYGAALVTSIHGCYFTVMGLPLAKLMKALHAFSNGRFGYFGTSSELTL